MVTDHDRLVILHLLILGCFVVWVETLKTVKQSLSKANNNQKIFINESVL